MFAKSQSACILAAALFAASPAAAETGADKKGVRLPDVNANAKVKPALQNEVLVKGLRCPNPAVRAIDFAIVARTSQFAGKVRITGVVKNMGGAYTSGPKQQSVQLYEVPLGGQPRFLKQMAFQNLASGQEVKIAHERNWNASSPSEGEFPPGYKVIIVYDPDIRLDGNVRNDDCASGDNQLEKSGSGINALFRAATTTSSGLTR
jgi:hypothetical protein